MFRAAFGAIILSVVIDRKLRSWLLLGPYRRKKCPSSLDECRSGWLPDIEDDEVAVQYGSDSLPRAEEETNE